MKTSSAVLAAAPQPGHYDIDPDRSRVTFATRHLFGLGRVKGSLAIRGGRADIADPLEVSALYAEIDTASFHTNNRQRDDRVRSPRFLDAAAHPGLSPPGPPPASTAPSSPSPRPAAWPPATST